MTLNVHKLKFWKITISHGTADFQGKYDLLDWCNGCIGKGYKQTCIITLYQLKKNKKNEQIGPCSTHNQYISVCIWFPEILFCWFVKIGFII